MPGPNFNFAVYLGGMAVAGPASSYSITTVIGAILASLGIFSPGISIGQDSRWLVAHACTFPSFEWLSIPPPIPILAGGLAGLGW
ncbi:hypothetical protein K443DRAFT_642404 [Laccaria amethystina LaAM-08-1]|uniref:Uncharacterized protein n=1 Tax=Laccaria amethystina LaAM-08-1 TaxID=1095629 RepID=A0A0C9WZE7_9AGAR|nr:hypothetical protein K443DRAFT_642404 [Laccaria amethystina LaAM-08-1]